MRSAGLPVNHLSEFSSADALIKYSHLRSGNPGQKLLMLHGAGVAGDLTWRFVTSYLEGWSEIVIPDLPGMGQSDFLFDRAPLTEDYLDAICGLVKQLGWEEIALVGYSFGGLLAIELLNALSAVTSLVLIEPAALLSPEAADLSMRAIQYESLAASIRKDPAAPAPYLEFLNTVSPRRVRNASIDKMAVERLMYRGTGLADGIGAVSESLTKRATEYAGWVSPVAGCSLVGGLSSQSMHQRHEKLSQRSPDWTSHVIDASDHGLVYTRPREIAKIINARILIG